jgi:hypothetical protein
VPTLSDLTASVGWCPVTAAIEGMGLRVIRGAAGEDREDGRARASLIDEQTTVPARCSP